jgi:hypothetical protein
MLKAFILKLLNSQSSNNKIKVELDPDGPSGPAGYIAYDTVKIATLKVELDLIDKTGVTSKIYGTARYGLPGEYKNTAKIIIKGGPCDYSIKLLASAGIKLDKPNQVNASTAEFQFEVTKVSATKDDLSIKAVDKDNNVLAEIKFTSYLWYKPKFQPCKIQHKDTNVLCALCEKAGIPNHEYNKPHPNKYNEIKNCQHCDHYCTPAVLFSLGYGKSQDDVAVSGQKIELFHRKGIWPSILKKKYKLRNLKGNGYFETVLNVYRALKKKKGVICSTQFHSRLAWGCYANTWKGEIIEPSFYYSDPAIKDAHRGSFKNIAQIYK